MARASFDQYVRFLNERLKIVKDDLNALITILVGDNQGQKAQQVAKLRDSVFLLRNSIAQHDWPSWINALGEPASNYNPSSPQTSNDVMMRAICKTYKSVNAQSWDHLSTQADGIDFDALFNEFNAQSRLPELYDKLIVMLEQIIASNQIDSITILRRLEILIATLKASRDSSLWSKVVSWQFAGDCLKHLVIGGLKQIPGLGLAVEAVEKAIAEIDTETAEIQRKVVLRIEERVKADLPKLEGPAVLRIEDHTAEAANPGA